MATLKKYTLDGKDAGEYQVDDSVLAPKAHPQSIKDYIVAIRKNARQWSANTKTRAELGRTGRKPHPQKGQGRSRQGDLAAPQYKGGGIVFGPKPKFDMHVRINKKERRAAIRAMIAEKIKGNRVHVLSGAVMEVPKTKTLADFFNKLDVGARRVLVLGDGNGGNANENFAKSLQNLQRKHYSRASQVNGYSLIVAHDLVVLESALEEFLAMLG